MNTRKDTPAAANPTAPVRRLSVALAAVGAVACTGLAIGLTLNGSTAHTNSAASPLDDHFITALLPRLSLEARALAAAGVSPEDATALSLRVRAFAAARDVKSELETLTRAANRSSSDPTSPTGGGTTVEQQRQAARDGITALLDETWTDAVSVLPEAQRELLRAIRTNAQSDLPMEYRVVQRTTAATVALRTALAEQRFAASRGASPSAESASLISAAEADPRVSDARSNLAMNLAAIEQALRPNTSGAPAQP